MGGALGYSSFDLPKGGTGTLQEGLRQKQFSKVLIMMGINEISTSRERYKDSVTALVQLIRDNQAQGVPIYILTITPTTTAKSESSDYNRKNVTRLNEVLAEVCGEQKCGLIDLYSCFADGNGYLPAEKSTDGVHFKAPQYRVMADYILSHNAPEEQGITLPPAWRAWLERQS